MAMAMSLCHGAPRLGMRSSLAPSGRSALSPSLKPVKLPTFDANPPLPLLLHTGRRANHRTMETRASNSVGGDIGDDSASDSVPSDLVLSFGEMLIDFVPTVNGVSLADAPAFLKAPGGAPANVAVGVSRLGGRSAFMGKVGDDEFGHMLCDILAQNNVQTDGVMFDKGARTALAFVTLKEDGEREFMFYRNPSADMLLQPEELNSKLINQAGIVHYGSISLIAEPCRSAHAALLDAAIQNKALLSYDPNLRLPLWSSPEVARKEIRSIWDKADIIKVSEDELCFLTEDSDPQSHESARSLMHDGLKLLLVTEGEKGCRYYTKNSHGRVEGWKVSAIDATGSGDAFISGFLYQLANNRTLIYDESALRESLAFANACGAIATTKRGAIPALPSLSDVHALIRSKNFSPNTSKLLPNL